jgi:hypothetical protein
MITLIERTLRVPRGTGPAGDGAAVARQLDATLAGVGFMCSEVLLRHVAELAPGPAMDLATAVVAAVRRAVGDHVQHNAYFVDFPEGVPDTVEFWVSCLRDALVHANDDVRPEVSGDGVLNLLSLPRYGRYQHTFAELLAAHDELISGAKDRVTLLHLGGSVEDEYLRLFTQLAGATAPLPDTDRELLADLAVRCWAAPPPEMPIRENRAVVNAARLAAGAPLVGIDTVTDVLRLACAASGGDPTLVEPTRFRGLGRPQRRTLLAALDAVVARRPDALADVPARAGRWKRLGEQLHPHEHPQFPHAAEVFAVARGDRQARSLIGRAELAFAADEPRRAAEVLAAAPGLLLRSMDRLLRTAPTEDRDAVLDLIAAAVPAASGRVLLSLREHVMNRADPEAGRVFIGRTRRAHAEPDRRPPLPEPVRDAVIALLDGELRIRLDALGPLVVDPAVLGVALPLTGSATAGGFAVLPRGSCTSVDAGLLRFFVHWRQRAQPTDFDLSALFLDESFRPVGHVSFTKLGHDGAVHSGDVVEAPRGATEFIEVPLATASAAYVIPQVNVYAGEGFEQVEESLFGWMLRDGAQQGMPFEPRTVRTRSELRGTGRVALPMAFARGPAGWTATWLHLYMRGNPVMNRVEGSVGHTSLLVEQLLRRRHLTVADLLALRSTEPALWAPGTEVPSGSTFVGIERPDELPADATVITISNLRDVIPQ